MMAGGAEGDLTLGVGRRIRQAAPQLVVGSALAIVARDPKLREELLNEFLRAYAPHLRKDGVLIFETTDAVSDYRLESDHFLDSDSQKIYPVRHTPEQVRRCAESNGLCVYDQKLCVSYGHHPSTTLLDRTIWARSDK